MLKEAHFIENKQMGDLRLTSSSKFSDENEGDSRSVMARLKESKWRTKRTPEAKEIFRTKSMHNECPHVSGTSVAEEPHLPRLPEYDVFLGGSCGTTVWRRQLVIPFLKKKAISYYDPQRSVWSENMIYEESIAKEAMVRSKRFCDNIVDDGSSSFIVPELLRRRAQYRQTMNVSSPATIELASSALDETSWVNRVVVPHLEYVLLDSKISKDYYKARAKG
ncbi:hypothetical protein TELCIR_09047 [Teladorsagia circumcincta]|uniref:Uncharacterized protein n=1 Tax=Teladorsagia circumcincta TaxID=45464 RepID=A0A2G9UFW5_TELCI|nr:hypothetical protein TELCIR_09047 [Teladorsagia circumcincta]